MNAPGMSFETWSNEELSQFLAASLRGVKIRRADYPESKLEAIPDAVAELRRRGYAVELPGNADEISAGNCYR